MKSKVRFILTVVLGIMIFSQAVAGDEIDGESFIRLAAGTFDPLSQWEMFPFHPEFYIDEYPDGEGAYLVQLFGPVDKAMKSGITELGVRIHGYIPDFTFLVWMDGVQKDQVGGLPFVRWVGLYQPQFRLASSLLQADSDKSSQPLQLRIDSFATESAHGAAKAAARLVEDLGGTVLSVVSANRVKARIARCELADLAREKTIRWIEPEPAYVFFNDQSRSIMDVDEYWSDLGLYGSGQIVALADSGLDRCECGTCSTFVLHDDFEDGTGASRLLAIYDVAGDSSCRDNVGHGTHVAGSIAGNGLLSGADPTTHTYPPTCFAGVAPEAGIIFQAMYDQSKGGAAIPPLDALFEQARSDGARIHSNSWGSTTLDQYTTDARDADQYMWDNQDFLILFSAGNAAADHDTDGVIDGANMATPATAKNVLTVGASERSSHSGDLDTWGGSWGKNFPVDPIFSDDVSDDDDGMAAFSSRGPVVDGRFKPDVVAPGTNIISTRSGIGGTGWGVYDSNYLYMGGTSMSTPLTAGAAVLIRQWFTDFEGVTPSAALLKAMIGNGAIDMAPGQYGLGAFREIPYAPEARNIQGLGRVNVANSVYPDGDLIYGDVSPGLETSGRYEKIFYVTDNNNPLRLTMAWTDCPGTESAGGGLVNDLDLSLDSPSETFYPDGANQRGASTVISYYEEEDIHINMASDIGRTVRFTPAEYPRRLDRALIRIYAPYGLLPRYINVRVYDDDGPMSTPGTVLYSETRIPIRKDDYFWFDYDLDPNILITEGAFYIEVYGESGEYGPPYFIYTESNVHYRSWDHDIPASTWVQRADREYGIRAVMKRNDYVWTFFDRVNNLLQIDLLYPDVGYYTMNVDGYNVPGCGGATEQPFAYAISGDIIDMECEMDFECSDGDVCNGLEACIENRCEEGSPLECDDGVFCNGEETCDPQHGCYDGKPVNCDNNIFCDGVEYCDAELDECVSVDEPCPDNGLFCDGVESCDEFNTCCVTTGDPCQGYVNCCEGGDYCSDEPCEECFMTLAF